MLYFIIMYYIILYKIHYVDNLLVSMDQYDNNHNNKRRKIIKNQMNYYTK
jgi:hypothetical protein